METSKSEVICVIEAVAQSKGIQPTDFVKFAYIETGGRFNPNAENKTTHAKGLFQFIPSTAKAYGIEGKEFDVQSNTEAAAQLYLDNKKTLENMGFKNLGVADMYLAHQQGAAGYKSIQNAIKEGKFLRTDTRNNMLINIYSDVLTVTGTSLEDFKKMNDRDMGKTFVDYWHKKVENTPIK